MKMFPGLVVTPFYMLGKLSLSSSINSISLNTITLIF